MQTSTQNKTKVRRFIRQMGQKRPRRVGDEGTLPSQCSLPYAVRAQFGTEYRKRQRGEAATKQDQTSASEACESFPK